MVVEHIQQPQDAAIEFWIGRDEQGFWTARDASGREGGLFVSRDAAVRFVETVRLRGHGVANNALAPLDLWK